MKRVNALVILLFTFWTLSAFGASAPNSAATRYGPPPAQVVDISLFYDQLSPYGRWVSVGEYGNCWIPGGIEAGWRPYSHGHWVYTDDYGWTWVSDYDWGWAPFHYGRWFFDNSYGWAWVPGTDWGPAWVAWRSGPGFIGWAALPPQAIWRGGVGFGGFDFDRFIEPRWYCFVDERHFTDGRLDRVLEVPARNVTFIRSTQNITRYSFQNNRIINHGIEINHVQQVTGRPVPRTRIVEARSIAEMRTRGGAGGIAVYRPQIDSRQPARTPTNAHTETTDQRDRRQLQEQENLEQQRLNEKSRLEAQHQAEMNNSRAQQRPQQPAQQARPQQPAQQPPPQVQDMRKRQQDEHQAHDDHWQKEQQAMQSRHDAERQGKIPPPPPPQRAAPQRPAPPPPQRSGPPPQQGRRPPN